MSDHTTPLGLSFGYEPDWCCLECGREWLDEEIRVEDECPACGCRYCLTWIGPF